MQLRMRLPDREFLLAGNETASKQAAKGTVSIDGKRCGLLLQKQSVISYGVLVLSAFPLFSLSRNSLWRSRYTLLSLILFLSVCV